MICTFLFNYVTKQIIFFKFFLEHAIYQAPLLIIRMKCYIEISETVERNAINTYFNTTERSPFGRAATKKRNDIKNAK